MADQADGRSPAERAFTLAAEHMAKTLWDKLGRLAPTFDIGMLPTPGEPWDGLSPRERALLVSACLALMGEVFDGKAT